MTDRNAIDRQANDEAARKALGLKVDGASDGAESGNGASRGVAGVDPRTGEVFGAGSGTGGGNPGEDYDDDHTAGSNTNR